MSEIKNADEAKEHVIDGLEELKNKISAINAVAVQYNLFKEMPTRILDLSCMADDIVGELQDGE